jgi:transcriptional regulator with XRE-family HTH domain
VAREAVARTIDQSAQAVDTIAAIGARIRALRLQRDMTLQRLGELTGLSASMLSLVERGRTSPSIGTLIVVCSALDVHMSDLLAGHGRLLRSPLSRSDEQPAIVTAEGVLRRILRDDRLRDVEIAINEYAPRTGSAAGPLSHAGYEYGVCLEGELTVELDGATYVLRPGDLISYESARAHRIWNYGRRRARALWINLQRA